MLIRMKKSSFSRLEMHLFLREMRCCSLFESELLMLVMYFYIRLVLL